MIDHNTTYPLSLVPARILSHVTINTKSISFTCSQLALHIILRTCLSLTRDNRYSNIIGHRTKYNNDYPRHCGEIPPHILALFCCGLLMHDKRSIPPRGRGKAAVLVLHDSWSAFWICCSSIAEEPIGSVRASNGASN